MMSEIRKLLPYLRWARKHLSYLPTLVGGGLLGYGLYASGDPDWLLSDDAPRVFVGSDCSASALALEFLEPSNILLIPTGQGEIDARACNHTRRVLVEGGAHWLRLDVLGGQRFCDRLTWWAGVRLSEAHDINGLPVISRKIDGDWSYHVGISDTSLSALVGEEIHGVVAIGDGAADDHGDDAQASH